MSAREPRVGDAVRKTSTDFLHDTDCRDTDQCSFCGHERQDHARWPLGCACRTEDDRRCRCLAFVGSFDEDTGAGEGGL